MHEEPALKGTIASDSDCAQFLSKLGISVSELARIDVPEDKRLELDQLSARIYAASADESVVQSIEAVLDNPDIKEAVLTKKQEKERVARNQKVGRTVEELLRKELEGAGIHVTRTGVGHDFEVEAEFDFVENGQEQFLEVGRYFLEVKSTSVPYARMTLRQGEEAAKPENRDKYVLCVVDIADGNVNDDVVREKARFVFGVGPLVETKVNEAKGFKDQEGELKQSGDGAVGIAIVDSSVKIQIGAPVWNVKGVTLHEFVERVKQGF